MRYLIDTNIIVYIISDPDSLDNDVKAIIADPDNILYTSAEQRLTDKTMEKGRRHAAFD